MMTTPITPERAMAEVAMRAATEYLARNGLTADPTALCKALTAHLKIALPQAFKDADEAIEAHMPTAIALTTFEASLALAGIEAAKEAGFPRGKTTWNTHQDRGA